MASNLPSVNGAGGQATGSPIVDNALAALRRMLYFRRQYDARRLAFYRQYVGQRDSRNFPDNLTPRSNTFVPYPYKNVEEVTSRVMDAFFSFDPWFECNGRLLQDEAASEAMGHVLHYMLKRSNFINEFEQLVRNICIYGHGGIKVDWDWDYDLVVYKDPIFAQGPDGQPILNPNTGQPIVMGSRPNQKPVPRMRPSFKAIDVYDLMVDPDGGISACLTEKTLSQMQREAQQNPQLYDPTAMQQLAERINAMEKGDPGSVIVRVAELWNEFENTVTVVTFGEDTAEILSYKDQRAAFRNAQYTPWKRKAYGGQTILLRHSSNPFSHHRSTILHTSFTKLPNEVYGMGAIESISDLTEGLNKFTNMIADNWNLGINKRYAYDINSDIDHAALRSFNTPGGLVGISGSPKEMIEPLPFFTPGAGDYQILSIYKDMIEMTSGVSDFYHSGVGSSEGNRTATGINSVMQESNFRFKMFIRNLELDVLQPLLGMCASMVQQFCTDNVEILITNAPASIPKQALVPPEQLIGNFGFELIAANYVTNKTVRQRTLMELMNLLANSPYINEYGALQEVAKVFEVRNINRILKTPDQVAQEQQAAAQAQMQQQVQMMILESMLNTESKARLSQAKPQPVGPGQGAGGGAPRKYTTPKSVPGAGLEGTIREFANSMGANIPGMLPNK